MHKLFLYYHSFFLLFLIVLSCNRNPNIKENKLIKVDSVIENDSIDNAKAPEIKDSLPKNLTYFEEIDLFNLQGLKPLHPQNLKYPCFALTKDSTVARLVCFTKKETFYETKYHHQKDYWLAITVIPHESGDEYFTTSIFEYINDEGIIRLNYRKNPLKDKDYELLTTSITTKNLIIKEYAIKFKTKIPPSPDVYKSLNTNDLRWEETLKINILDGVLVQEKDFKNYGTPKDSYKKRECFELKNHNFFWWYFFGYSLKHNEC